MKILHVAPGLVPIPPYKGGGTENYIYNLSKELINLGVNVNIINREFNDHIRKNANTVLGPRVLKYKVRKFSITNAFSSKEDIINEIIYAFLIADFKKLFQMFDIIHLHSPYSGLIISKKLKKLYNKPKFVYTCHNGMWMYYEVPKSEKMVRAIEVSIMLQSDAIIIPSKCMLKNIVKYLIKNDYKRIYNKIYLVGHGVDVNYFNPEQLDPNIESKLIKILNLDNYEKIIIYVGRIEPSKGTHILIKSIEILMKENPDILLIIAGPLSGKFSRQGGYSKYTLRLIDYVKRKGLNVIFTNSIDHNLLRYLYSLSNLMVMPSSFESFGLVILESMAMGTPVIASNICTFKEIIIDGYNGLLFERENLSSLNESIMMVLNDESFLKKLSYNAIRTAKLRSWENIAKIIYNLYKQVMLDRNG